MTENGDRHTFKRSDLIDEIIKMRLDNGLSRHTMLRILMEEFKYKQSFAYQLIREAKEEFDRRAIQNFAEDLKEDIERWERMRERYKEKNDWKGEREAMREIGKLKGHYVERMEMTIKEYKSKWPDIADNKEEDN